MVASYNPSLTIQDIAVWHNLAGDVDVCHQRHRPPNSDDKSTIRLLSNTNNPKTEEYQPTVFTSWDNSDIAPSIDTYLVKPYKQWAKRIVRRPTDVVFLTHILLYLATSTPSAIRLYLQFNWPHAIFHWMMTGYYCGAFTLMLHNHIHNNGVLASQYSVFDRMWPYILEPLMGHTWDSYYYHHVKHHHVENNGPGDLSSTIRFQRDELSHFLCYVARFLFLIWFELPLYFYRRGKRSLAVRSGVSELISYAFIFFMAKQNMRATIFVLLIPLVQMRVGMMVGNWGQHALVDEVEPDSDFRSSITLIDVPVRNTYFCVFSACEDRHASCPALFTMHFKCDDETVLI